MTTKLPHKILTSALFLMLLFLTLSLSVFGQIKSPPPRPTPAPTPKASRADQLKAEGDTYYNNKDYQTAISKYQQAVAADPNHAPSYWMMGISYGVLHKHDLAAAAFILDYSKVKNLDNYYKAFILYQAGDQYRLHGDKDNTKLVFEAAVKQTPIGKPDYESISRIYSYWGNLDQAVNYQIRAINFTTDDDDTNNYLSLSWEYSFLKRHQEAVNAATTVINLKPDIAMAYTNRCRAYNDLKLYDRAIADCNTSLRMNPNHGETMYYLSNSYKFKNNVKQSKSYLQLAIPRLVEEAKLNDTNHEISAADNYYLLGNAYSENAQFNEAAGAYKKGIELRPNSPAMLYNIGILFLRAKDKTGANNAYKVLLDIDPKRANDLKQKIDTN